METWVDYTGEQNFTIRGTTKQNKSMAEGTSQAAWKGKKATNGVEWGEWKGDVPKLLKLCEERGIDPPFVRFKDHPNYYKLLVDRRIYDAKGKFIEQKVVDANFDMKAVQKVMDDYRKPDSTPVQEVVDEFMAKQPKQSAALNEKGIEKVKAKGFKPEKMKVKGEKTDLHYKPPTEEAVTQRAQGLSAGSFKIKHGGQTYTVSPTGKTFNKDGAKMVEVVFDLQGGARTEAIPEPLFNELRKNGVMPGQSKKSASISKTTPESNKVKLGDGKEYNEYDIVANAGRTARGRKNEVGSTHARGIIDELQGKSVIDWGSGKGLDMKFYKENGASSVQGYDPNHNPTLPSGKADVVTNTFVGNVIPPRIRRQMWTDAFKRAKEKLYVAVRAEKNMGGEPVYDGVLMGKPPKDGGLGSRTFQKFYDQAELLRELREIFPSQNVEAGWVKSGGVVSAVVERKP